MNERSEPTTEEIDLYAILRTLAFILEFYDKAGEYSLIQTTKATVKIAKRVIESQQREIERLGREYASMTARYVAEKFRYDTEKARADAAVADLTEHCECTYCYYKNSNKRGVICYPCFGSGGHLNNFKWRGEKGKVTT